MTCRDWFCVRLKEEILRESSKKFNFGVKKVYWHVPFQIDILPSLVFFLSSRSHSYWCFMMKFTFRNIIIMIIIILMILNSVSHFINASHSFSYSDGCNFAVWWISAENCLDKYLNISCLLSRFKNSAIFLLAIRFSETSFLTTYVFLYKYIRMCSCQLVKY